MVMCYKLIVVKFHSNVQMKDSCNVRDHACIDCRLLQGRLFTIQNALDHYHRLSVKAQQCLFKWLLKLDEKTL